MQWDIFAKQGIFGGEKGHCRTKYRIIWHKI